jgi:hypothetical protein
MTRAEFERLRADASAFGKTLGLSVTLRMLTACRPRIMLHVVRFIPLEWPREYRAAHGHWPDSPNLKRRIFADIKTAALKLRAVRSP